MEELENPAAIIGGDGNDALAAMLALAFGAAVLSSGGLLAAALAAGIVLGK